MPAHNRFPDAPRIVSDADLDTYFDTNEYRAYSIRVLKVIARSQEGVTTADIHRVLGDDRQAWTQDVLDGAGLEATGVLPTRYKLGRGGKGIPPADAFQVGKAAAKIEANLGLG